MRDLRAERIHRKKVKRARRWKFERRAAGGDPTKRQGKESTSGAHVSYWVGTDKVSRTSEFDRIQDKKERRRTRRQKEAV